MKSHIAALALAALAAPVFATTTASITAGSFAVTLKDLNTGDSVTPGLTWDSHWNLYGNSGYYTQVGLELVSYSWGSSLQATFSPYTYDWQSQSAPVTSLSGTTLGGTGAYSAQIDAQGGLTLSAQQSVGSGLSANVSTQFNRGFWLTAGTQVTFSMLVNRELTGTAYAGSWTPPVNTSYPGFSSAGANVTMWIGSATTSLYMTGYGGYVNPAAYTLYGEDDQIKLLVRNTTDTAQYYSLGIYAALNASEGLDPATITVVPEPTTAALMALGLIGLTGLARRRQA